MLRAALALALTGSAASFATPAAAGTFSIPLVCTKGPSDQRFQVRVTMPSTAAAGATYSARIDDVGPGNVSETGLNFLHDQAVDYVLPKGASLVPGSAHVVAGTGTENVRAGARVVVRGGVVTLMLPGKVANKTSFTMPSIELELKATGAPGSAAELGFAQYRLVANAFLVGDVAVSCDGAPKPYRLGRTAITAPEQP